MITLFDKYYDYYVLGEPGKKPSIDEVIIFEIVRDLKNRKGIGDEWDELDEDIQNEIMTHWHEILINHLSIS